MKKKLLGLCLLVICLLGCASTKDETISLANGKVVSVQNNTITLAIDNSIPHSNKTFTQKDEIQIKLIIDDDTLFLKNGCIVSQDDLIAGTRIIFSEEKNKLILVEIIDSAS